MYSIVILGDVRRHEINGLNAADDKQQTAQKALSLPGSHIYGGAYMMCQAITRAIHRADPLSPPRIYSYDKIEPAYIEDKSNFAEFFRWNVEKKEFEPSSRTRYVLGDQVHVGGVVLPPVEAKLRNLLITGGFRTNPESILKQHMQEEWTRKYELLQVYSEAFDKLLDVLQEHCHETERDFDRKLYRPDCSSEVRSILSGAFRELVTMFNGDVSKINEKLDSIINLVDQKSRDARENHANQTEAIEAFVLKLLTSAQEEELLSGVKVDSVESASQHRVLRDDGTFLSDDLGLKFVDCYLPPEADDGSANCSQQESEIAPDVLVIDDLNLQCSNFRFIISDEDDVDEISSSNREYIERVSTVLWSYQLKYERNSREYLAAQSDPKKFHQISNCYEELSSWAKFQTHYVLKLLIARLKASTKTAANSGAKFPIEPVVILSAADNIPDIESLQTREKDSGNSSHAQKFTVWQHLYRDKVLRRRTIVMFDAVTLRDEISISAGLSWERTAQDTIVEFKRSEKLRPYLKFGHIIIRYGITGVLLISNDGNDDWSYTLYFNPDQDDVNWTHRDDGVVLGATSIIAASIVEQLNERCSWRRGQAVLSDLRLAIDQALLLSVQRLLTHFEHGYGKESDDFECLRQSNWFDDLVFTPRAEVLNEKRPGAADINRIAVQRVKLLPFRSRHWSILAQSCQTDLNNVARDIVFHGPEVALNTLENPAGDFVNFWLEKALDHFYTAQVPHQRKFLLYEFSEEEVKVFSEQLTKSLRDALKEEQSRPIRRLIGESVFRSVEKLMGKLEISNVVMSEIARKIAGNNNNLEAIRKEVLKSLTTKTNLEGQKEWLQKNFQHALDGKENPLNQFAYLFLSGIDQLISELNLVSSASGENYDDSQVRQIYGIVRDTLRTNARTWLIADNWRDEDVVIDCKAIEQSLAQIDLVGLADPRSILHQELLNLIERNEPVRGWSSPISTPILRLGKKPDRDGVDKRQMIVDRKEVESIRPVKRLIEQYLDEYELNQAMPADDRKSLRPLSIAVFGPPGSGKSTAVRNTLSMMKNTGLDVTHKTINLSQLPNVEAFHKKLKEVIQGRGGNLPIIFFDEFDSSLDKKNSWLKYFLALMEDGEYGEKEPVEAGIFVFAGGTCKTFEEFSMEDGTRSDKDWAEFSEAKGPDFVSRLSGHFNVVGINPASPDDDLYLIRRALALRYLLSVWQKLSDTKKAKIDANMLNALLHVPDYIHGSRSMKMLVDLCKNRDKKTVAMSEVPPIHQLNMQVDGKAFAALASGYTKPVLDETSE